jgi:hypothetical protein
MSTVMHLREKCVYVHKTMEGDVFYVGAGSIYRAYGNADRGAMWYAFVSSLDRYMVDIVYLSADPAKVRAKEQEYLDKYFPSANNHKKSHYHNSKGKPLTAK